MTVEIGLKMQRVEDGRSYYTFEYGLRTPIYATTSFATVTVGNSKVYIIKSEETASSYGRLFEDSSDLTTHNKLVSLYYLYSLYDYNIM